MRRIASTASLSILASIAICATLGASAASAKVCSTSGTGENCGGTHGNIYTGKIVATLSTPSVEKLISGFIIVTCGEATLEGEITNGETGAGDITKLTEADCHSNLNTTSGSCKASTTASSTNKWPASVVVTTAPNGTMTIENLTTTLECSTPPFGTSTCHYSAAKASVGFNGGEPATVVANGVPLVREGTNSANCSATATWSGTYIVTTPTSIFIT
jgi:hypothetical protein